MHGRWKIKEDVERKGWCESLGTRVVDAKKAESPKNHTIQKIKFQGKEGGFMMR